MIPRRGSGNDNAAEHNDCQQNTEQLFHLVYPFPVPAGDRQQTPDNAFYHPRAEKSMENAIPEASSALKRKQSAPQAEPARFSTG
jgi:hypothetical protein